MPVEEQIAVLYCGVNGLLKELKNSDVLTFERRLLDVLRATHKDDILTPLAEGRLEESVTQALTEVAAEVVETFK